MRKDIEGKLKRYGEISTFWVEVRPLVAASIKTESFDSLLFETINRIQHTGNCIKSIIETDQGQGDNAFALARKSIEDYVSIKYIFSKGREKYTKKFYDHSNVELKQLYILAKDSGFIDLNKRKPYIETLKDLFKNPLKEKGNKTWAGISIDDMMKSLSERGDWDHRTYSLFQAQYLFSCRLLHFSPDDLSRYAEAENINPISERNNCLVALDCVIFPFYDLIRIILSELGQSNILENYIVYIARIEDIYKS